MQVSCTKGRLASLPFLVKLLKQRFHRVNLTSISIFNSNCIIAHGQQQQYRSSREIEKRRPCATNPRKSLVISSVNIELIKSFCLQQNVRHSLLQDNQNKTKMKIFIICIIILLSRLEKIEHYILIVSSFFFFF